MVRNSLVRSWMVVETIARRLWRRGWQRASCGRVVGVEYSEAQGEAMNEEKVGADSLKAAIGSLLKDSRAEGQSQSDMARKQWHGVQVGVVKGTNL